MIILPICSKKVTSMKLNKDCWQYFGLSDIFTKMESGKVSQAYQLEDGGDLPYLGAKKDDNGVMAWCAYNQELVSRGNCVVLICDGQGSVGLANYMNVDFLGTTNLMLCYNENHLNPFTGLFLATVLSQERKKYSFGRKWKTHLNDTLIKLPADKYGHPDWEYMENYIKSLNYMPLTTTNTGLNSLKLTVETWKPFKIGELFDVKYGINMELNTCVLADNDDKEAINFVARTESNNGVSARVKPVDGKTPQPAGTITCAGGGSVLSTFLQTQPFYSGRDLYLLIPKIPMSDCAKLFCITVIKANKYRYSYGQANITLPHLELMLPADNLGKPDFQFMEDYIRSLPYGDRV